MSLKKASMRKSYPLLTLNIEFTAEENLIIVRAIAYFIEKKLGIPIRETERWYHTYKSIKENPIVEKLAYRISEMSEAKRLGYAIILGGLFLEIASRLSDDK